MTDTFSRPILMADNSPLRMLTRTTGSGSSKLKTISLPSARLAIVLAANLIWMRPDRS